MTELQNRSAYSTRFQTIFAMAIAFSLITATFVGLNLVTAKNCIIIPISPFDKYGFCEASVRVCALDVILLWVLTFPKTKGMTIFVSSCVFCLRGLVIGNALRVFFENSVPSTAIVILVSYCAVTLLSVFYDAFLNGLGDRGILSRLLSGFVVTGASALIRIIPMLLLEI